MKPALSRFLVCALLLVAGFGAQAQGDEVLDRYGLALVNLSESLRLLDSDVTASRDELDRAAGALRFLAGRAGSPELVEAMDRAFERARTAILNRSSTDLAVQSALLRGGFQRALYDSAAAQLATERELALGRIDRLASDLGLPAETRAALAEAPDAAALRRAFEGAVAERVREQLALSAEQYSQSRDLAYRTLADAYSDFLLIQDSPRAGADLNRNFAVAAEGLVGGRGDEMTQALETLTQGFTQLARAAEATPPSETPAETPADAQGAPAGANPEGAAPSAEAEAAAEEASAEEAGADATAETGPSPAVAAVEPAGAAPATVAPQAVQPQQAEGAGAAPAAAAAPESAQTGVETAESGTPPTADETGGVSTVGAAAEPAAEGASALRVELIAAGVPPARAEELAERLRSEGVAGLESAVDGVYRSAAVLLAALQAGEDERAQAALEEFAEEYQSNLQPVVKAVSAAVDTRTSDLIDSLLAAPAPRTRDALVLLGQVDAIDRLLDRAPVDEVQAANVALVGIWAGWPRLIAMIVLALLAVVPLYLLNLAFGGGNRNWQLVGVALFLLLLPLIYEGLASAGAVAAELAGLPVLDVLAAYSIFESPIARVAWAAMSATALVFATVGLYGICVQFGLVGNRSSTVGDPQLTRATTAASDADTVVDWDEEF